MPSAGSVVRGVVYLVCVLAVVTAAGVGLLVVEESGLVVEREM